MISKNYDNYKDSALYRTFCKYVESGDIRGVHLRLLSAIVTDGVIYGSYERFDIMEQYASKRIKSLYDKHADATTDEYGYKPLGGELISDKSKWDEDYVFDVYGYLLDYNFSRERIKYLKKIVRYVYMADIITGAIFRDIKFKYNIRIHFSDSLKGFKLNKDNKEEFKRLVMEEVKKQLESSKNESIYNDIINGSYFNEIKYI